MHSSLPPIDPSAPPVATPFDPAIENLYVPAEQIANELALAPYKSGGGLWLIGTFILFVASIGWLDPVTVAIISAVLFFHEAGHYLGMQAFGYKDVRMFFIPFMGAAVSGKKHAAPAWQQAIVLLLGPVPGIILAVVMYVLLRPSDVSDWRLQTVAMLLLINGLNLLPAMPLDGGRVLHLLIFRRHPALETTFKVLAIGGLALISLLLGMWFLLGLSVFLAINIPYGHRLATRARWLRTTFPSVAGDWRSLGEAERRELFQQALELVPPDRQPAHIAVRMLQLHEAAATNSPDATTTILFLLLYCGVIFCTPIAGLVIAIDVHNQQERAKAAAAPLDPAKRDQP